MARADYTSIMGDPLPIRDLVAIWQGLPERKRLGFLLQEMLREANLNARAVFCATGFE